MTVDEYTLNVPFHWNQQQLFTIHAFLTCQLLTEVYCCRTVKRSAHTYASSLINKATVSELEVTICNMKSTKYLQLEASSRICRFRNATSTSMKCNVGMVIS
ncbi:hypothetical protein T10_7782 [Trichinella papuae]|uniref:Uncharacterized protein n=1 Tax=Trichinella papuae TaxID=268474 RepID=A0A0V1MG55_9BILA|nr:hypothetical protein T10_7782 [Trichinella papuae]